MDVHGGPRPGQATAAGRRHHSALIAARDEDDALTEYELVWWSQGVLLGGYETTANHLGSGIIYLLTHPDQLALLRNDPSLVPRAVEECLRMEVLLGSPAALRCAEDDITTLDGVVIPKGAGVIPLMESANYDESVFPEPDTSDIHRPNSHRHMAFSSGPHRCVGAAVARIELQTAMTALLHRFPNLRLAVEPTELRRQQGGVIEGFVHIPVTW
ncbi:cytochrome P450 [Streptomyces sp. NPDC056632]|uniref:cytochrome P450 n=1 Tax=Streptomyces sp. NPDC056632 TaxID=3345884 RepID=UPI00368D292C